MATTDDSKAPEGTDKPEGDESTPETPENQAPSIDAATAKELEDLRAFRAQVQRDKEQAEADKLKAKGEFEKLSAQQAQQLETRTAEFRQELLKRDVRSHVLEHLDPEHRKKADLVIAAVSAKLGDVEWDGLTLKSNVGKAAREVVNDLGFAVVEASQKRTSAPPARSTSQDRQTQRPSGDGDDRILTPRELISQGVSDAFAKRAGA